MTAEHHPCSDDRRAACSLRVSAPLPGKGWRGFGETGPAASDATSLGNSRVRRPDRQARNPCDSDLTTRLLAGIRSCAPLFVSRRSLVR